MTYIEELIKEHCPNGVECLNSQGSDCSNLQIRKGVSLSTTVVGGVL